MSATTDVVSTSTEPQPGAAPGPLGDLGPLVLGGNVFGWTADRAASFAVLDAFVAAGGRSIDTADVYSAWVPGHVGGESEVILGEWLAAHGARDAVVIATKVAKHPQVRGLAGETVARGLEASLQRLGADRIDLYYAHEDDAERTPEEIAATFGALVADGRIGAVGLSNFSADRLRAVVAAARAAGVAAPAYSQDRWNLVERGLETSLLPTLLELDVAELPYSSLASGFLTGKYRAGVEVASPRAGGAGAYLARRGALDLLAVLTQIAEGRGVAPAAVALAWLRQQPGVGAPLASARDLNQLGDLVASFTLVLDPVELDRLDLASAAVTAA